MERGLGRRRRSREGGAMPGGGMGLVVGLGRRGGGVEYIYIRGAPASRSMPFAAPRSRHPTSSMPLPYSPVRCLRLITHTISFMRRAAVELRCLSSSSTGLHICLSLIPDWKRQQTMATKR